MGVYDAPFDPPYKNQFNRMFKKRKQAEAYLHWLKTDPDMIKAKEEYHDDLWEIDWDLMEGPDYGDGPEFDGYEERVSPIDLSGYEKGCTAIVLADNSEGKTKIDAIDDGFHDQYVWDDDLEMYLDREEEGSYE